MNTIILVTCIAAVAFAGPSLKDRWVSFKKVHGKVYQNPKEEQYRLSIFAKNLEAIEEHNSKHDAGLTTYRMRMNHFGDLLPEEFLQLMGGLNTAVTNEDQPNKCLEKKIDPPEAFDWRTEGAVTPVKNQGFTRSCWAFSTTGAMEGRLFLRNNKTLVSLSEQQLVDCSTDFGNKGCQGGLMDYAYKYLISVGGLDSEDSYPYEAVNKECRYRPDLAVEGTTIEGLCDLPKGDEEALKIAVANVGPVSVAVHSENDGFRFYHSGIFDGQTCGAGVDHALLLVGYGSEDGHDFWILKNSWGPWGDEGYMKLARNLNNACGIADLASYPVFPNET